MNMSDGSDISESEDEEMFVNYTMSTYGVRF